MFDSEKTSQSQKGVRNMGTLRNPSSPTEIHCRTSVSFILNTQVDSVCNPRGLKEKPHLSHWNPLSHFSLVHSKHTGGFSLQSEGTEGETPPLPLKSIVALQSRSFWNTQVDSVYNPTGLKEKPLLSHWNQLSHFSLVHSKHTGGFSLQSQGTEGESPTLPLKSIVVHSKHTGGFSLQTRWLKKDYTVSSPTEIYCRRSVSFLPNTHYRYLA